MIDYAANILILIIFGLWIITIFQGRRMYRAFLAKFPLEATKLIPYAFSSWRHPEKFFFFFRKSSRHLLLADPAVWKERQRFKWMLVICFALPAMAFITAAIFTFLQPAR